MNAKVKETAAQIIGAFFMEMGEPPWIAGDIIGRLEQAGYEILHKSVLTPLRRDAAYGNRRRVKLIRRRTNQFDNGQIEDRSR